MLDVSSSRLFCSNFILHLSFMNSNFIHFRCLQKFSLEEEVDMLICTYLKQSITFGSNNFAIGVLASLLQHPTITCKHSSNVHGIMYSYKEVHQGLVWIIMNYAYIGPIMFGAQSKFLLQLPSTPQVLVFLLKFCTQKVKKCLDQPNARHTFHLS